MWLPKYNFITDYALTKQCSLMCSECTNWTNSEPFEFATWPNTKIINFCGGDPLLYPELPILLQKCRVNHQIILLTTNGLNLEKAQPELLKLIDLLIIYTPAFSKESLLTETGLNTFSRYQQLFDYLKEIKKTFLVNYPVTLDNLADIPELVYYLQKNPKAFLWLNYQRHPENFLQKESIDYLKYFAKHRRIIFSNRKKTKPAHCLGCNPSTYNLSPANIWFLLSSYFKIYF